MVWHTPRHLEETQTPRSPGQSVGLRGGNLVGVGAFFEKKVGPTSAPQWFGGLLLSDAMLTSQEHEPPCVKKVVPGGSAERLAFIQEGDILLAVNDAEVNDMRSASRFFSSATVVRP